MYLNYIHFFQIIEEQLAFPSGTATAHLISVLHQLPPPETSVRRREGYHQADEEEHSRDIAAETPVVEETHEEDETEREIVEHEGWHDLLWSFAVSGFLTVSLISRIPWKIINLRSVICLLLPCPFRNPYIRQLSGARLAMVFHPKSVICWPRFVIRV